VSKKEDVTLTSLAKNGNANIDFVTILVENTTFCLSARQTS